MAAPAHNNAASVSSIELFFDLVFVFVITQVTQLVEHAHGAMDFLRRCWCWCRSGGCTRVMRG
jgi:low temperature requirement protein LtrA